MGSDVRRPPGTPPPVVLYAPTAPPKAPWVPDGAVTDFADTGAVVPKVAVFAVATVALPVTSARTAAVGRRCLFTGRHPTKEPNTVIATMVPVSILSIYQGLVRHALGKPGISVKISDISPPRCRGPARPGAARRRLPGTCDRGPPTLDPAPAPASAGSWPAWPRRIAGHHAHDGRQLRRPPASAKPARFCYNAEP